MSLARALAGASMIGSNEPAPYLVVTLPKGFHEDLVRAMAHA